MKKQIKECNCLCHGTPPDHPTSGGLKLWCNNCQAKPQDWQHKPQDSTEEKDYALLNAITYLLSDEGKKKIEELVKKIKAT